MAQCLEWRKSMGSYNRFKFDVNTDDQKLIDSILTIGSEIGGESIKDLFRQYCESTKWDGAFVLEKLSSKFPTLIFRLDVAGETTGTWFYLNGENVAEIFVFQRPIFPSHKQFYDGQQMKRTSNEIKRRKAKEQEEINKQKEIKALEQKLAELKNGRT